jgi:hypothetical protein
MVDLLRRVVSDEAADALLAPFTLGTAKVVAELLADVFPDAAATRHQGTARFESIRAWLHTDIRGWTLAELIDDPTYERLLTEALTVLPYTDEAGRSGSPPQPSSLPRPNPPDRPGTPGC